MLVIGGWVGRTTIQVNTQNIWEISQPTFTNIATYFISLVRFVNSFMSNSAEDQNVENCAPYRSHICPRHRTQCECAMGARGWEYLSTDKGASLPVIAVESQRRKLVI